MSGKRKKTDKISSFSYQGPTNQIGSSRQDCLTNTIVGAIVTLVGVGIVLIACSVFPIPESSFKAPHWVVAAAGAFFSLTGLTALLQGLGVSPNSLIFKLTGLLLLPCLVAPFAWFILGDSHAPIDARIIVGLFFSFFALVIGGGVILGSNTKFMRKLAKNNPEMLEKIEEMERQKKKKR